MNKNQFKREVEIAIQQTTKLLCIYQSINRTFEYEVSEESRIKEACFALKKLEKLLK